MKMSAITDLGANPIVPAISSNRLDSIGQRLASVNVYSRPWGSVAEGAAAPRVAAPAFGPTTEAALNVGIHETANLEVQMQAM
jgi:hypothetical protein